MALEAGKVYHISAVKTGYAATLEAPTLLADRFEGKPNQFWKAQSTPAGFWSFESVEHPKIYLGFKFGRVLQDGDVIYGVTQPFYWEVKHLRTDEMSSIFKLFIPYTDQVLDLDDHGGWANGIKVQVYHDHGDNHVDHQWRIDPDLTFDPLVKAGEVYQIVNCHTGTVVHLENSNNVVLDPPFLIDAYWD
ncbi:hypothetical protein EST38_g7705 [Candolleomyces aberdarensis]|uniref:Uncharacterized protein n=1 Tax=Candolleomyces aberdarensis TaxID=2316362 RepID=A0A4Q2DEG4_9AGAR|nr:hypothetical protein EST38_g7705 [Candolleomyces aberdarensis]